VIVWRICRKPFSTEPLAGKGGAVAAGRWHSRGTRIVYTSATLSLAALELLVNAETDLVPSDLVSIKIEVPDDIETTEVTTARLPTNWHHTPAPAALQELGEKWIRRAKTALLRVPSAVIPEERNYLINPAHPDVSRISIAEIRDFVLDSRLL
jgi:RES domain-containing protein